MHAVTRLGRVIQQLRSFGELHASELDGLAAELAERAQGDDAAGRLRIYRDVQRDETQLVVDELVDIQIDLAAANQAELTSAGQVEHTAAADLTSGAASDPAVNSPKRARWLAEQAAEVERRQQPLSRRDFFGGGAPKSDSQ